MEGIAGIEAMEEMKAISAMEEIAGMKGITGDALYPFNPFYRFYPFHLFYRFRPLTSQERLSISFPCNVLYHILGIAMPLKHICYLWAHLCNSPHTISVRGRNSDGCQRGSATAPPYALRHPTSGNDRIVQFDLELGRCPRPRMCANHRRLTGIRGMG